MNYPAQVQKQSDRVKELYSEMAGVADPATDIDGEHDEPKTDGDEPKPPVTPVATSTNEETFEQKYRTLQGMYNAEVPRLHAQVKELTAARTDLATRVKQLEDLLGSVETAQPTARKGEKLVTDSETAEYGETLDVMRRAAREEAAAAYEPAMEQLRAQIAELKALSPQVADVAAQQQEQIRAAFWTGLNSAVPNWRDINADQDFKTWLLEPDPITGQTKQDALSFAETNKDLAKVVLIFDKWLEFSGQGGSVTPQPQPKPKAHTELELQTAPGRGRASTPKDHGAKKIWSSQDISNFYRDRTLGLYKGKEDECARLEADLFAAQAEGRVTK